MNENLFNRAAISIYVRLSVRIQLALQPVTQNTDPLKKKLYIMFVLTYTEILSFTYIIKLYLILHSSLTFFCSIRHMNRGIRSSNAIWLYFNIKLCVYWSCIHLITLCILYTIAANILLCLSLLCRSMPSLWLLFAFYWHRILVYKASLSSKEVNKILYSYAQPHMKQGICSYSDIIVSLFIFWYYHWYQESWYEVVIVHEVNYNPDLLSFCIVSKFRRFII